MRLEMQHMAALCVVLLLGGIVSLSLFLVMVFLIEPERAITSHIPRAHVVNFVALEHKKKAKKTPGKRIAIPKLSGHPEPAPTGADVLQRITPKKIAMRISRIGRIKIYSAGEAKNSDLRIDTGERYSPEDGRKIFFNRAERRYLKPGKEQSLPPQRVRIPGGGEIDRIGDTCFELSGTGGPGGSDAGQTAIAKDRNFAMHSLSARQVPCDKTNNSFARDFLKQLKERKLVMAPVAATN